MPTVQELETELQKARDAEKQQQREREAELFQAKLREELLLTDGYMVELHKAVSAKGITCEVKKGFVGQYNSVRYATLAYPEDSAPFKASAEPELSRRSKSYSSSYSYQIQFGGYGEKKTYPRLKDGTFNYAKIAEELASFIESKSRSRAYAEKRAANYKASKEIVNRLESTHQLVSGTSLWGSEHDSSKVELRVKTLYSEAEVSQILDLFAEIEKARDSAGRN